MKVPRWRSRRPLFSACARGGGWRAGVAAVVATILGTFVGQAVAKEGPKPFDVELYTRGQRIFESQCIFCHGRYGRGDGEWSNVVKDRPRNLTTGIFKFRTTPMGFLPTEADLARTIRTGISGTMMPTFAKLNDSDLKGVIAYVKSFSSRWEDAKNYAEPVAIPDTPAWFGGPEATKHAEAGAEVFRQTCFTCHGVDGKGHGPASKALKDAWGNAITPADLTQPHKSGSLPTDLFRTISLGLDGTPMVGFRGTYSDEQIWNLVAFVFSLAPAGDESAPSR
jgi:mono/diheme cytochrome c family protein